MFQDRFDRKQISSIVHTTKFGLAEFDCDFNVPRLSCGVISVRLSKGVISPKFPTKNRLSLSVIYGIYI